MAGKKSLGNFIKIALITASILCIVTRTDAGVIKDIWEKITDEGNRTVKQSAPVCGNNLFSTSDQKSLSPEVVFITSRPAKTEPANSDSSGSDDETSSYDRYKKKKSNSESVNEVANEFRFHVENVTLEELESNGFNRNAPTTFMMHGFTSGYPMQAWISAIVESYTIDRDGMYLDDLDEDYENTRRSDSSSYGSGRRTSQERVKKVKHNLFVINWNYAARGIVYPRAVANIPIVASYMTRFINEKLLGEAGMEPRRIQLIGHSLGAHLAGFIGKNTDSKLGRIYGLDPAGPCFGALSGPLYPASKRLAPSDAEEVITVHTNTAMLGIEKPLGKYSVYVEGGETQPGCKGGTVMKSISTFTTDGPDFDKVSCSHSRAPNLLSYRHDQSDSLDDCQLVAYECEDWDAFTDGRCGNCRSGRFSHLYSHYYPELADTDTDPLRQVECVRIGLDWQYPRRRSTSSRRKSEKDKNKDKDWARPTSSDESSTSSPSSTTRSSYEDIYSYSSSSSSSSSRRYKPTRPSRDETESSTSRYAYLDDDDDSESSYAKYYVSRRSSTKRPSRERRDSGNSSRASEDEEIKPKVMFLKTGDTQPYCVYQYQVVLELNEPITRKKPSMSLIMQDSERDSDEDSAAAASTGRKPSTSKKSEQNSITTDNFGNKYNETIYTHLITSGKKLKKIDHATLLFSQGLPNGHSIIKQLHINYLSHIDRTVRKRLSTRLCPVKTESDRSRTTSGNNRYFFEPCEDLNVPSSTPSYSSRPSRRPNYSDSESDSESGSSSRRPYYNSDSETRPSRRPSYDSDSETGSSSSRRPYYNSDSENRPSRRPSFNS